MSDSIPARGHAESGRQQRLALAALIAGGMLIGCSPILVRLSELGPVATGFWRLTLAVLPLFFLSARAGQNGLARPRGLRDFLLICAPGILLATDLTAWHVSLYYTSVANSTLIVNMAPIFVTFYVWLFLGRRPGASFLVALAVTVAGVFILKGGPQAFGNGNLFGDALALIAAIAYAGYLIALAKVRERFDTGTIMVWGTAVGALCILPVTLLSEPVLVPSTLTGWSIVLALAWLIHLGGQGLITYALAWLPTTFSSLTLLQQPVIGAVLAWALLGEALTPWQGIGGLIVLSGIWLAHHAQRRRPERVPKS